MDYVSTEKLKWRSRRSMLELDLYFERFINTGEFAKLNEVELLAYQHLLTLEDSDLLVLFQWKQELADPELQAVVNKIAQINFYKEYFMTEQANLSPEAVKSVKVDFGNGSVVEYPIYKATIGQDVVDFRTFGKSGMWSYDPAFLATAACESKITYIEILDNEFCFIFVYTIIMDGW